jgi:fumarate reductase subunit D
MQLSSSWLWLAAGLYLLFEIWRGWRRGVMRHGMSVLALIVAGGVGWIFAWMTGFISDRIIPLPYPGGRLIFGLMAGLAFYFAAVALSSMLFKKTSQQPPGLVRLLFGAGGGLFGLIFGLLILWGGISMFRTMGAVAEARQTAPGDEQLVAIKQSLEEGTTGGIVEQVDIVPSNIYVLITKLLRVTRSPEATARFFAYPQAQQLLAQPKIVELFADPSLTAAASEGDYFSLLTNPKLGEIASDASVQESFKNFELEKALDYALQDSAPSPVPTP